MATGDKADNIRRLLQFEIMCSSDQCTRKFQLEPRTLFTLILKTVEEVQDLDDTTVCLIKNMASRLYESKSDSLQKMTLKFIRDLLDIFAEQGPKDNRGNIVTKLLEFYQDVVFPSSRRSKLFSKASEHAVKLCSHPSPVRGHALKVFDLRCFASFPLNRFKEDAIGNLLCITSQKIHTHRHLGETVPAAISFLSELSRTQDSRDLVVKVCPVLSRLLEVSSKRKLDDNFARIRASKLFEWALTSVDKCTKKQSTSIAVAQLMKDAFKFGDGPTRNLLVHLGGFEKVRHMFEEGRPKVTAQLLDFIKEVCSAQEPAFVDYALKYALISRVAALVGYSPNALSIGVRASDTLDSFFGFAGIEQIFQALEDGLLFQTIRLLDSKHEQAVFNALRWLFVLTEIADTANDKELLPRFENSMVKLRGDKAMLRLIAHKNFRISRLATAAYERFIGSRKPRKEAGEARLESNRRFVHENAWL